MAGASHADVSGWRGSSPAVSAPAPASGVPAWRAAQAPAAYRSRWWKLGGVAAALGACLVAVSYAALWLKPPDTVRIIVLEADYDTNLTVPPNATGVGAGQDLIHFVNSSTASRGRLKASEPVRLTRGGTLLPELDSFKERTAVIFVAAHGGRDPEGAFLFPDDTTPDPKHRVRIKAVIDRLAKLPAKSHKLLILDATQPPHYADLGILHNDFAEALEQLDADIAAVPNLVVVSSAGTDQRSWVCPEWGRTVFAHYLVEGLEGAADADRNQRLTAWEIFEHVRPRVHDWSRDNRAALQTPVILPKADGEHRAKAITLASVTSTEAKPPVAPAPFEPPAELEQQWQEYDKLASASPAPIAYAPHIWREYEAWVLRYEHLLLHGNPEAAESARAKAADAKRRIESLRKLPVTPQTLNLPFALGGLSRPVVFPVAIDDGIAKLASTPDAERGKTWASLRDSLTGIEPDAARLLWCEGLVAWVARDPATRLVAAPALIAIVTEGMAVRPSEIHLLAMYAAQAPKFAKADDLGPLLGSLLELRAYAEGTLARQDSGWEHHVNRLDSIYSLPWTKPGVERGDVSRRIAEDLAFATNPSSWDEATKRLNESSQIYENSRFYDSMHKLVGQWQFSAATLPGIAAWQSKAPSGDGQTALPEWERQKEAIVSLWNYSHEAADFLAKGPDLDPAKRSIGLPRTGEMGFSPLLYSDKTQSLHKLWGEAYNRLLASRPEFAAETESRREMTGWLLSADALLAAPLRDGTPPKDRVKLASELRRASRQLLVTGTTQPKPLKEVTAETTKERAFQTARWLGLVQLARVGSQPNNRDLVFHLNNFALQADGRKTLAAVGAEIGAALNSSPESVENPTLAQLYESDRQLRIMPATNDLGREDGLRRALTAQVLLAQAERTYLDHWYGGEKPYYKVAIGALLKDARAILGRDLDKPIESLWAARLEKESPFPLTPVVGSKLWLTDEPNLGVTYQLQRAAIDPAGPGFAVFWQEPPFGAASGRIPREVRETGLPMSAAPPEPVAATIAPPAGEKPKAPTTLTGTGTFQAFFRGRFADTNSVVQYYPVPDRASVVLPAPPGATMAVRADPALNAKFGTATGSVAFVIDCSGSMRPPKDAPVGENGRYPVAIDTLEKLLRGLPQGTNVAVLSFGSRQPDITSADDTIRLELEPTAWRRDNSEVIDSLLAKLRGLEPWEESSVMRALLRARQGLVGAPGPFKAVVLVSDAVDNRFAQDPQFNPRREAIKDALKTRFADTGVRIGVVGIPVTDKDEAAAQLHFKSVESLAPSGKFVTPDQAESLLAWLKSGLNPRIFFSVAPLDGTKGPSFDLSAGDDAADTWYPGRMPAGSYLLSLNAGRDYRFPLSVRRGDRLLLRLAEERGEVVAQRIWYAAEAPAVARSKTERQGSILALMQNQAPDAKTLKLFAALEDMPAAMSFVLGAEHLGDAWFNLTPATPKAEPFALRFTAEPGYPAPCFALDANGWPTLPDGKTAAAHTLEAWWTPDGPAAAALRWEAPPGVNLQELPPTRLAVNDNVVSLDSIRLEQHEVPVGEDRFAKRTCLAVRFTHAEGKPVWARLVGLAPAGSEVRVYRAANKVTCLFWWPGETTIPLQDLKGLEIVSLIDFQKDAEAAGRHLKLTDAPPPTPASARPQPPAAQ